MSGGGGSQPSSSTVTQTNLPEYARPYFENMMNDAQNTAQTPYQSYQGQRLADYTPMQGVALNSANNMATQGVSGNYDAGSNLTAAAGMRALSPTFQSPISDGPSMVNAPSNLTAYQQGPVQQVQAERAGINDWDQGQANKYMSPYIQSALDPQLNQIQRQYQQDQAGRDTQAVRAGAFGGSRAAVADSLAQQQRDTMMAQVEGSGMNTAYGNAQQQFNAQQQAGLGAQQMNIQGGLQAQQANQGAALEQAGANQQSLLGVQGLGAQLSMQAQLANQQAMMQNQAQQLAASEFGSQQYMQGNQLAMQAGQGLAGIAGQKQQGQMGLINMQNQYGQQLQQYGQQANDIGYQDFLNQINYPRQTLNWESGILHGVPVTSNQDTSTFAYPNAAAQLAGAGIAGAGLSKMI